MVATLAVPTLIEAAHRIGVELHKVNSGGNLYVWHTPPPEEAVVYIGKSASDKRPNEERGWRDGLDTKAEIEGFSGTPDVMRILFHLTACQHKRMACPRKD
jgi:hypothetical protein